MKNILIIGSGQFGVAMSQILLDNKNNVYMTSKNPIVAKEIMLGKHDAFHSLKLIPPQMCYLNYEDAFKNEIDVILLCIPSNAINQTFNEIKRYLKKDMIIINAAKGLNPNDYKVWSNLFEIDEKMLPYALLVGPSFASEIINKEKTIVNIVSNDKNLCGDLKKIFDNNYFKLIYFDDEYVASLVSSFKNALAVGLGLLHSFTKSFNTLSAYLVIGIKEIQLLVEKLTGNNEVKILDFFGVGDIYLTCNSDESRNYQFGYNIGQHGISSAENTLTKSTIEGYQTLKLIHNFIIEKNINCPLFSTLYQICYENLNPHEFINKIWNEIN